MFSRLTRGRMLVGDIQFTTGKSVHILSGTVARTDTSAKTLFTLPANFVLTSLRVYAATVSNAGTTATLSVGKSGGNGHEYLNAFDVKGATGSGQQVPTGGVLGTVGTSAVTVQGTYAETGAASSAGGPWTVIVEGTTS